MDKLREVHDYNYDRYELQLTDNKIPGNLYLLIILDNKIFNNVRDFIIMRNPFIRAFHGSFRSYYYDMKGVNSYTEEMKNILDQIQDNKCDFTTVRKLIKKYEELFTMAIDEYLKDRYPIETYRNFVISKEVCFINDKWKAEFDKKNKEE